MRGRAKFVIDECLRLAQFTEEPGRITRRFLSPPMHEVHKYLRERMTGLGMSVTVDAAGNMRGLWRPEGAGHRRLVIGSHVDTVPNAGAYDGVLGVCLGLELVREVKEREIPLAIEVIAFSEEEGVRFGVPFIGSRAVAGRFDPALLALRDFDGVTLDSAIRNYGLDPTKIAGAVLDEHAAAMLEIHIEQGPVLEAEGLSVAAVTDIVGQTRMSLCFAGRANHAGTTPMHLRHDALAGAAEWMVAVERIARGTDGLIATVGKIEVEPNAGNVVPGAATVSLDLRHSKDSERQAQLESLLVKAGDIADRRGLTLESKRLMDQPAVPMDEQLTAFLVEAMEALGLPPKRMPSGAGHDAMVIAARVPTAMLFLRSPGGISHHPDEAVREEDVENALRVTTRFLERLAADIK
ncbi:MAG TPA: allantoate amidohydrolase [Terracidiphilus sp.]|nr:allantoate amidohydrolase [Terracidiphilus sp.]